MNLIIEGVDRSGKSSLIQALLQEFGPFVVIHSGKPTDSKMVHELFKKDVEDGESSLKIFQEVYFSQLFNLMRTSTANKVNLIFDRAHLGEFVYAPRYRNYDGSYVFKEEVRFGLANTDTYLILLNITNFSKIVDDGKSFDFSAKEAEQRDFIEAFQNSTLKKKMINVTTKNGDYKSRKTIVREITNFIRDN